MPGYNVTALPEILPGMVLKALIKRAPAFDLFSMTFEKGASAPGTKTRGFVYNVGSTAPAAFDRSTNNYDNGTAPDADSVDLTFNAPFKETKIITPFHLETGLRLELVIDAMLKNLTANFHSSVLGAILNANFPTPKIVGASSALTAKVLGSMANKEAAIAGWDEIHMGLTPDYYANLLNDSDLKTHTPSEDEQLLTGRARTTFGWDLVNLPWLTTNGENLVGFATDRSGIAIVTAPNANAPGSEGQLALYEVVQDPRTGITVTLRGYYARSTNEFMLTAEILAAYGIGRSAGLLRLTSA
jgi:hypothetical protein